MRLLVVTILIYFVFIAVFVSLNEYSSPKDSISSNSLLERVQGDVTSGVSDEQVHR